MTFAERSRIGVAVLLEYRQDRGDVHYDDINPSTLIHPNGTLLSTGDVAVSNALTRAVVDCYQETI
jgi:hypothetical protein